MPNTFENRAADFRRKVLLSNSLVFPKSYFKYITSPQAVKRFFEIVI